VQHEFRGHNGGREGVAGPVDGGESCDCAVGERVGERAHTDHDEEFEAVVFEGQGEGGEALVVGDEAVDEVFEKGARADEGGGAAGDGRSGGYEPAGEVLVVISAQAWRDYAHPFGKPYTKPAMVMRVPYPINGGKDTVKIKAQRISHPALMSLHFFATGSKLPNIFSLYIRNKIPRTASTMLPRKRSTFWTGVSLLYASITRRFSLS
jgi:hypothetical protein